MTPNLRLPVEGDFILPSLGRRFRYADTTACDRVQAVFLHEDDEEQIAQNFLAREGRPQPRRSQLSWMEGQWLRQEAQRLGIATVSAPPWATVLERGIAAVL